MKRNEAWVFGNGSVFSFSMPSTFRPYFRVICIYICILYIHIHTRLTFGILSKWLPSKIGQKTIKNHPKFDTLIFESIRKVRRVCICIWNINVYIHWFSKVYKKLDGYVYVRISSNFSYTLEMNYMLRFSKLYEKLDG